MSALRDWSIARQLTVGFAGLILILASLLGTVFHLQSKIREAERVFIEEIEPGRAQTERLQRAIMYVGLGLRSYLLQGGAQHLVRFRHAVDEARKATADLVIRVDGKQGPLSYRVDDYLEKCIDAVERRASGPLPLSEEITLASLRQDLVDEVQSVAKQQNQRARAALAKMAVVREQVWRGVVGTSLLALVGFIASGVLMARTIRRSTHELLATAATVASGDWRPALALARTPSEKQHSAAPSEIGQIARAFGVMAGHLERRERRLVVEGELARIAASSLEPGVLIEPSVRAVIDHLSPEIAVLYLWDEELELLVPTFRHALEGQIEALTLGTGIPGQAASSRRTVVVRDIPHDSGFRVSLGYDEAPPKCVVATPVRAHERLFGVLVVASLREQDEEAIAFLERAASQLGVGLANATAYRTTQRLLGEVRERSELIQAQNEELQAQNEEIQAQSEEIQAQSEQLQAQQEEIQAQNEELKRHAEDLQTHAKQLRDADERKTEFLGVLAHELRNPLAPIVNGLYLLRVAGVDAEKGQRALAVIERQVEHLTKLVDDLLDVTRIARGKVRLERRPVDLVSLVHACVEDQRGAIEGKGLLLKVELPDTEILVNGDRTRLSQVVGNLLHNASKFTDRGGWIAVRLAGGPDEVELRVADSGIGIDKALMDVLFTPFVQGTTSLARASGGLGLGLALVKSLISLHGGTAAAYSEGPGKGTEFTVKLPRLRSRPDVDRSPEVSPAAPRPRRVLIIEDSKDAADTLREVLELQGHSVAVAHSGPDGLRLALEMQPEVILCDLGLPVLNGYEVAKRVRAEPQLADVLLVAVSGYASSGDRRRAAEAGFDHHLAKPLGMDRIQEIFDAGARGGMRSRN